MIVRAVIILRGRCFNTMEGMLSSAAEVLFGRCLRIFSTVSVLQKILFCSIVVMGLVALLRLVKVIIVSFLCLQAFSSSRSLLVVLVTVSRSLMPWLRCLGELMDS